jgi:hypothetical protein
VLWEGPQEHDFNLDNLCSSPVALGASNGSVPVFEVWFDRESCGSSCWSRCFYKSFQDLLAAVEVGRNGDSHPAHNSTLVDFTSPFGRATVPSRRSPSKPELLWLGVAAPPKTDRTSEGCAAISPSGDRFIGLLAGRIWSPDLPWSDFPNQNCDLSHPRCPTNSFVAGIGPTAKSAPVLGLGTCFRDTPWCTTSLN